MKARIGDDRDADDPTRNKFGSRGEWWVVAQFTLGPVYVVVTWLTRAEQSWVAGAAPWLGVLLALLGIVFLAGGIFSLGRNLTPVPAPIDGGALVESGLYRIVRHPIYTGVILGALAWALLCSSVIGLALCVAAFLFFDRKSRLEETWLAERYPGYPAYRRRVRKLVPFVY